MCRFVFGRVVVEQSAARTICRAWRGPDCCAACLPCAPCLFALLGGSVTFGAALTWDPAGTSTLGGAGTWTTSTATKNWWNGTSTAAWASGNDAWFTGPTAAGAVTLANPLSANNLFFTENGYSLNIATSADTLTSPAAALPSARGPQRSTRIFWAAPR